ncbi:hypothetical protein N8247_00255 [bacterium]|jgi:hypothetical protein|nr:hypothetical protein [bacterium]MDC1331753.1 hypothetical protein [bacterium]|tara:strand:- start:1453 stop:1638 length:186 start_codon:yes stop_codon:yes gene_type:complete
MFDLDSKIRALVQNYGLELLLEQNEIPEEFVVAWLIDEKRIDVEDYFNLDAELQEWKRIEE